MTINILLMRTLVIIKLATNLIKHLGLTRQEQFCSEHKHTKYIKNDHGLTFDPINGIKGFKLMHRYKLQGYTM